MEGFLDWKRWLEAANRGDEVNKGRESDQDKEPEGQSLVGEDEDGRIFSTTMSLERCQ